MPFTPEQQREFQGRRVAYLKVQHEAMHPEWRSGYMEGWNSAIKTMNNCAILKNDEVAEFIIPVDEIEKEVRAEINRNLKTGGFNEG